MKTQNQVKLPQTINLNRRDPNFNAEVQCRSGVNLDLCWHCKSCANGCPFSHAMDFVPNEVIRLVQLGQRKEALQNTGIWICVGCNTCSVQCPNSIDIPAINDALRAMAVEEGAAIAEPHILHFHQAVLQSIRRYGRTHKLEIMLRYKLKKRDWLSDLAVGLKMFVKRKLELLPSKAAGIKDIKRLFQHKKIDIKACRLDK